MVMTHTRLHAWRRFQHEPRDGFGSSGNRFRSVPILSRDTKLPIGAGRVLALLDDDNLRISLRNRGFALSYRTLRTRLAEAVESVEAWVALSDNDGAVARGRYLEQRGWNVVQVPRQTVMHRGVPTVKANVDNEIAFLAGRLSAKESFETILLGTGDGDLAVAVARCLREYTSAAIVTLSVPGCSSQRLTDPALFSERIFIGRDLVVPARRPSLRTPVSRQQLIV
jgi:hypothetical protein